MTQPTTQLIIKSTDNTNNTDNINTTQLISQPLPPLPLPPPYLTRTLFDRLHSIGWDTIMLHTQYRCHPDIANICNNLFYHGMLRHDISTYQRLSLIPRLPPVIAMECRGQVRRSSSSSNCRVGNDSSSRCSC